MQHKFLLFSLVALCIAATPMQIIDQNTVPEGITAGSTHFEDVWARDALYASWGALALNNTQGARNTLETLFDHQRDGQIPLRVGRKHMWLVLLHLPSPTGAVYANDKSNEPALDPNCLAIITLHKYYDVTNELLASEQQVQQAIDWLSQREDERGLIIEGPYASWDDAIRKKGASIYSNACYYASLQSAAVLLDNQTYADRADRVRHAIQEHLWNGEYYDAWDGKHVLDVPANLLAIHYNVPEEEQAIAILDTLDTFKNASNHTFPKTNYPHFPKQDVYLLFRLIGMGDYHNHGPDWSWIAALEALVRAEQHETAQAQHLLDALYNKIDAYGTIHEIYDDDGLPVKRLAYTSEKDFSWTAGMMLLAEHETFK